MTKDRPYSIHFVILVFGQVISIFGNCIVSFVLSLYVLEETGSASTFAFITAISAIPWAISGPIGGMLADKISKKKIMVTLDFITATIIFCIAIIGFERFGAVLIIGIVKFLFAIIFSIYSPCVSSSLVFLVKPDYLVKANSLTSGVNSVASILGPVFAGILYSFMEVEHILYIGGITFLLCAIIECFMKIPRKSLNPHHEDENESFSVKQSFRFLIHHNKYLFRFMLFAALAAMSITSIVTIGLPYIVNIYLDLPSQYYGISSGVISCASLVAGAILWNFSKILTFARSGYIYIASGIVLLLMSLSLYLFTGVSAFFALCATLFILMISNTMIYILMHSFIQRISPPNMLGKIMSCVTILVGFADPSGQVIYGMLFDNQNIHPSLIIFISGLFVLLISTFAISTCKKAVLAVEKH